MCVSNESKILYAVWNKKVKHKLREPWEMNKVEQHRTWLLRAKRNKNKRKKRGGRILRAEGKQRPPNQSGDVYWSVVTLDALTVPFVHWISFVYRVGCLDNWYVQFVV